MSTDDYLRQAATDIVKILTNPPTNQLPPYEAGDTFKNDLLKLAERIQRTDKLPCWSAEKYAHTYPLLL